MDFKLQINCLVDKEVGRCRYIEDGKIQNCGPKPVRYIFGFLVQKCYYNQLAIQTSAQSVGK